MTRVTVNAGLVQSPARRRDQAVETKSDVKYAAWNIATPARQACQDIDCQSPQATITAEPANNMGARNMQPAPKPAKAMREINQSTVPPPRTILDAQPQCSLRKKRSHRCIRPSIRWRTLVLDCHAA